MKMRQMNEVFVGRTEELSIIQSWIDNPSERFVVNFHGIGGSGKTELANQIVKRWPDQTVKLDFGHANVAHTKEQVLESIGNALFSGEFRAEYHDTLARIEYKQFEKISGIQTDVYIEEGAQVRDVYSGVFIKADKRVAEDERERRLKEHIRILHEMLSVFSDDYPCIIMFDHFEALEMDIPFRDWILGTFLAKEYRENLRNVGVVFLSRIRVTNLTNTERINQKKMPNLSEGECIEYLATNNIDNEDLHSFVYRLTKGHPLSLFLSTDLIQKGNFNTAEISTDLLKKKTEETLVMEFLVGTILKREADSSVKDALSSIPVFRIVNAQAIVEILDWDLSRAVDTIIKLEERGFLSRVSDDGLWIFHDLLRELLLKNLINTASLRGYKKVHRKAIAYYDTLSCDEDLSSSEFFMCIVEPFYHLQEISTKEAWDYFEGKFKPQLDRRERDICRILVSQIDFSKIDSEAFAAWFRFRTADYFREFGEYKNAILEYTYLLNEFVPQHNIQDAKLITSILNNIGWTYIFYEQDQSIEKSIEYSELALQSAKKAGLSHIASMSLNNLGIAWGRKKVYDKAINFYKESLKITESKENQNSLAHRLVAGMSRQNLGDLYMDQDDFEKAEEQFNLAFEHYQYAKSDHYVNRTIMLYGHLLLRKRDIEKALVAFIKSIEYWQTRAEHGRHANTLFYAGICHEIREEYDLLIQAHSVCCQVSLFDSLEHHQSLVVTGIIPFMLFLYVKRGKKIFDQYYKTLLTNWNTHEIFRKIEAFDAFLKEKSKELLRFKYYTLDDKTCFHKVGCQLSHNLYFDSKIQPFENWGEIEQETYSSCRFCCD